MCNVNTERSNVKNIISLVLVLFSLTVSANPQSKRNGEFEAFLVKVDAAQVELQNGKAGAFKAVWSQGDDVTLSGGFGGTVE